MIDNINCNIKFVLCKQLKNRLHAAVHLISTKITNDIKIEPLGECVSDALSAF